MPDENTVTLRVAGGPPSIEVIIGSAQVGSYSLTLWQPNNAHTQIGAGANSDDIADVFPLGKLTSLNGCRVSWNILVTSPVGGSGQLYHVSVLIRQDGQLAPGGLFQESGQLDGTKAVFGLRKIVVV
jgi:hypothetical protein